MTRMHLHTISDEELVREARLGRREAFDEIVRRFRDTMIAIAQQTMGSREVAEDVVQDAFLQALQALPQLQDPAKVSHWLFVITRYRARRIGAREGRCEPTDAVTLDRLLAQGGERSMDPADECTRTDDLRSIRTALSRLPPEYERVLRLYYYEEWPLRRIAAYLSVPISTVKWRLHHARHLLRRQLTAPLGAAAATDTICGLRRSHSLTEVSMGTGIRERRLRRSEPSARRAGASPALDCIAERRLRRHSSRDRRHSASLLILGRLRSGARSQLDGDQRTNRKRGTPGSPAINGPVCPWESRLKPAGYSQPWEHPQGRSRSFPQDRPVHLWPGNRGPETPDSFS